MPRSPPLSYGDRWITENPLGPSLSNTWCMHSSGDFVSTGNQSQVFFSALEADKRANLIRNKLMVRTISHILLISSRSRTRAVARRVTCGRCEKTLSAVWLRTTRIGPTSFCAAVRACLAWSKVGTIELTWKERYQHRARREVTVSVNLKIDKPVGARKRMSLAAVRHRATTKP